MLADSPDDSAFSLNISHGERIRCLANLAVQNFIEMRDKTRRCISGKKEARSSARRFVPGFILRSNHGHFTRIPTLPGRDGARLQDRMSTPPWRSFCDRLRV